MQIKIDARDLDKLVRQVDKMRQQTKVAIAQGLNEGGDKTRTKVQRALQKQAGLVKYGSVTSRVKTRRAFASEGGVESYEIRVLSKPTKMFEYKTQVTKGPGGGVTAWLWGVAHKFKRSFEGAGKIAGQLKMRTTGPRLPTRSFDGPNLAKEAEKGETAKTFLDTAAPACYAAIAKRLGRLL